MPCEQWVRSCVTPIAGREIHLMCSPLREAVTVHLNTDISLPQPRNEMGHDWPERLDPHHFSLRLAHLLYVSCFTFSTQSNSSDPKPDPSSFT
jgi:hypothetical protein